MKFSTDVTLPEYPFSIEYQSKLFSIGSCFSDNVGQRLKRLKFDCTNNPAGVLFNPISILNLLSNCLEGSKINTNRIIERDGLFFHYDYHSQIYAITEIELVEKLQSTNNHIKDQLLVSNVCILTLGTSWVYEFMNTVVANCHKIPANQFTKRLLGLDEMKTAFKRFHQLLKSVNPNCQILLTVSPIRHWKEGASQNQISKSILHVLRHELCADFENVHYFPSYEILMDELRDYRYYAEDLLHPSKSAFEHIWKAFANSFLTTEIKKKTNDLNKLLEGIEHKVLYPESKSHLKHLQYLEKEVIAIQDDSISLEEELALIRRRINELIKG